MSVTRFGQIQADAFLGSALDNSPFGKVWYVDSTNGANGNSGQAPDEAYADVATAISASVATRGDTVIIYPGTYTITAALVPKAYTTFRAAIVNPHKPSVIIAGNVAELVTVDVSGCRFIGLEFKTTGSTCVELVDIADGADVSGCLFEDCVFSGTLTTGFGHSAVGVVADDATYAVTGLVVRRCVFKDLEIQSLLEIGVLGMPYAKIEDNVFVLRTTTSTGIAIANTAGTSGVTDVAKGLYVIRNNDFIGLYSKTHVGITIGGTENTLPPYMIRNNYFANCAAAAITTDKAGINLINNYVGDTGTGGTLVDAGN